jgi:hypothetical protein
VVGANAGREKGTFPALEPAHPSVAALPSASSVRSSRTTP